MSSLRSLKNRISALNSVGKIAEASRLVAAAEVKKYSKSMGDRLDLSSLEQVFILAFTSYLNQKCPLASKTKRFLGLEEIASPKLVIVIGSCKGLCGPFNVELINFAKEIQASDTHFLVVGNKLRRLWTKVLPMLDHIPVDDGKRHHLGEWQDWLLNTLKIYDNFSEISFLYHRYSSIVRQDVVLERMLPFSLPVLANEPLEIWDPDLGTVLENMADLYLLYKLNNTLLHKQLSEHTARMNAMEKASKNTKDLVEDLTIEYNKCRQAFITKEICEIIAGTIG